MINVIAKRLEQSESRRSNLLNRVTYLGHKNAVIA